MILSKPDIQAEFEREGGFRLEPAPDPEDVDQVSLNLRVGRRFATFGKLPSYIDAIRIKESLFESNDLWDRVESDSFVLQPGTFVLAQTLERVEMPNDLMGLVEGRSSWARAGISVHLTAPKIDPGFVGTITLEIVNVGPATVRLVPGEDKPAQLMLMKLSEELDESLTYGSRPGDNFQFQNRPIPEPRRSR